MRAPVHVLAAGLAAMVFVAASPARADGLTQEETARLSRRETVIRETTFERGDRRYIGGLTYTIVDATPAEIASVVENVNAYRHVLPQTKRARLVGQQGEDQLVELAQGNALASAEYTIRVRRGARQWRFWLEQARPHSIDDAWGFFRVEPFVGPSGEPRLLLTYGVLVDVGPGLVREFFEERVRAALLSVPQLVRRYVAEARRPL